MAICAIHEKKRYIMWGKRKCFFLQTVTSDINSQLQHTRQNAFRCRKWRTSIVRFFVGTSNL